MSKEFMYVERCSGTIISIPFDHHKIDALLYGKANHKKHQEERPVILRLHGTLGNLLDETEHELPSVLAAEGYCTLTMNTLLANLGLFFGFGIFDDTMPQIDKACDFLKGLGFQKILIAGHGLGGCMAIRYGALRSDPLKYPTIMGVIAFATPYSLPDAIRRRWKRFGSEPTYDEIYLRAKRIFRPLAGKEPDRDETFIVKKAHGETYLPKDSEVYTLKTWWSLAGPEAEGTKVYKHIGKVEVPILLVHALHDDIIERRKSEDLGKVAIDAGNNDVTQFFLDTGHTFERKHDELGQITLKWVKDRFA
jgi:pimeloyl-ACP methyl ester carboxylesterase